MPFIKWVKLFTVNVLARGFVLLILKTQNHRIYWEKCDLLERKCCVMSYEMTTLNLKSGRAAIAIYDTAETLSEIRTHAAEKRKVSQRFLHVQLFGPALGFSRYLLLILSKMCQGNENCAYQLSLHVSDFFFLMISKLLALCVTIFPNLVLFPLDSATSLHRMLESRMKKKLLKTLNKLKELQIAHSPPWRLYLF